MLQAVGAHTSMRVCRRCRSLYRASAKFCAIDGQALEGTNDDPLLGTQLGRYRIISLLGRGTTGSVYRATHSELGSDFALKVSTGTTRSKAATSSAFGGRPRPSARSGAPGSRRCSTSSKTMAGWCTS